MSHTIPATLIPGDGIGPEIVAEAVKVLIQAGADLNVKNQLGLTALDFAVRGNRQNAKELIETGLQREAARAAKAQSTMPASVDPSATVNASGR